MAMNRRVRSAAHLASALRGASRPGGPSLFTRVRAVPRMVRAVRTGEYTGISSARLLGLVAGIGYIVSPIDAVPEGLLLALGLLDDVVVIGWVAASLVRETEDFLLWEQLTATGNGPRSAGQWNRPPADTVRSYVVPD